MTQRYLAGKAQPETASVPWPRRAARRNPQRLRGEARMLQNDGRVRKVA
jgi:hypothetical protein